MRTLSRLKAFLLAIAMLSPVMAQPTAAQITAYCQANMPVAPVVVVPAFTQGTPSPDANPNDSLYIEMSNENLAVNEVYGLNGLNGTNPQLLNQFSYTAHLWEQAGKTGAVPTCPVFQIVDTGSDSRSFDAWWKQFQAFFIQGDPNYGNDSFVDSMVANKFFVQSAPAIAPYAAPVVTTTAVVTDGPVGAPVVGNPGLFLSAGPADTYANGATYIGPTGMYRKTVVSTPFASLWFWKQL